MNRVKAAWYCLRGYGVMHNVHLTGNGDNTVNTHSMNGKQLWLYVSYDKNTVRWTVER